MLAVVPDIRSREIAMKISAVRIDFVKTSEIEDIYEIVNLEEHGQSA